METRPDTMGVGQRWNHILHDLNFCFIRTLVGTNLREDIADSRSDMSVEVVVEDLVVVSVTDFRETSEPCGFFDTGVETRCLSGEEVKPESRLLGPPQSKEVSRSIPLSMIRKLYVFGNMCLSIRWSLLF